MGQTAENLLETRAIDREAQDRFALRSQQKAAAARERGRFSREIVPVPIPAAGKGKSATVFDRDEFIRPDSTLEGLAQLKPAFRLDGKGTVTAGNASGLNDGAATLLLASRTGLTTHRLTPIARVLAVTAAGVEPRIMGIGPVPAIRKVLAQTGLGLDHMDLIEINEAFAAQVLSCTRELGLADDDPRLNVNGGAIALGHPLGMSGARLALTAARELEERRARYALVALCIGVGQGMAAVLERV
jgi:acetyl-CoA acyltransferase